MVRWHTQVRCERRLQMKNHTSPFNRWVIFSNLSKLMLCIFVLRDCVHFGLTIQLQLQYVSYSKKKRKKCHYNGLLWLILSPGFRECNGVTAGPKCAIQSGPQGLQMVTQGLMRKGQCACFDHSQYIAGCCTLYISIKCKYIMFSLVS